MNVQSKVDEGTTVTVALPLVPRTPMAEQPSSNIATLTPALRSAITRAIPSGEEKCLRNDRGRRDAAPPPRREGGCSRSGSRAWPCDAHPAAQPEGHGGGRCWRLPPSAPSSPTRCSCRPDAIRRRCSARSSTMPAPALVPQSVAASAPGRSRARVLPSPRRRNREPVEAEACRDQRPRSQDAIQ